MPTIMTLAQEIFQEKPNKASKDALALVEALVGAEFIDQEKQEEILKHEDLASFFKKGRKESSGEKKPRGKKKTTDPSERDGKVDEEKCLARIWAGTGKNSNYDNVQCSAKKVEGCDCFCKQHFAKDLACKKIDGLDGWFLGIVTEDKPEKIKQPTKWDAKKKEYTGEVSEDLRWSDSVEEKPKKVKKVTEEKSDDEDEEKDEYSKLKVPDLRELCEERGLSKTGKKSELVERLKENDEKEDDEEQEEEEKEEEEKEDGGEGVGLPPPHPKGVEARKRKEKAEKEKAEKDEEELNEDESDESDGEDEDEDEDKYHEHEGVSYQLFDCELTDIKTGKVIGKIEGGEVTLTKKGSKLHAKNVEAKDK